MRTLVAAALLVAAAVAFHLPGWQAERALAARMPPGGDPLSGYDRWFGAMITHLPATGRVGYLPPADWPAIEGVRDFYLAQYALAPRILVTGTDPSFVIVTPGTGVRADTAATDPRLAGFTLVGRFEEGLLLFRRLE
jgi:hypothetical protein